MFPSLAAWETYVAETNFASRKQTMLLPKVKNIFASETFPSLVTIEANLTSAKFCPRLLPNVFIMHMLAQCFRNHVSSVACLPLI